MGKAKKSETSVPQPKLPDYIKAVQQLLTGFLTRHKKLVQVILLIGLVVAGWLTFQVVRDGSELTNDEVVAIVNQRMGLTESNPAILEVVDDQKVSQPFLEEAQNGDKVLLYYQTGKSVLFRPHNESIVREGVFSPPDAKVFIRDSENDGAALNDLAESLKSVDGIDIVSRDRTNAEYTSTLVVNVTDRYPDEIRKVAEVLDAEVVRLPKGETIPDADILVIYGR